MQFWHRLERMRSLLLRVRAWSVSSWPPPRQTHYWGSKDDGRVPFSPAFGAQNGLPITSVHRSFPLSDLVRPSEELDREYYSPLWNGLLYWDVIRSGLTTFFCTKKKTFCLLKLCHRVQNQIYILSPSTLQTTYFPP